MWEGVKQLHHRLLFCFEVYITSGDTMKLFLIDECSWKPAHKRGNRSFLALSPLSRIFCFTVRLLKNLWKSSVSRKGFRVELISPGSSLDDSWQTPLVLPFYIYVHSHIRLSISLKLFTMDVVAIWRYFLCCLIFVLLFEQG